MKLKQYLKSINLSISSEEPENPEPGELYYDTKSNQLKIQAENFWMPYMPIQAEDRTRKHIDEFCKEHLHGVPYEEIINLLKEHKPEYFV